MKNHLSSCLFKFFYRNIDILMVMIRFHHITKKFSTYINHLYNFLQIHHQLVIEPKISIASACLTSFLPKTITDLTIFIALTFTGMTWIRMLAAQVSSTVAEKASFIAQVSTMYAVLTVSVAKVACFYTLSLTMHAIVDFNGASTCRAI